jgi:Fungal protein kinase
MHIEIFNTYNQYAAHKSLCEDLKILHRDISFTNLLLTRPSSTDFSVGLLINFDYAQHIQRNEDTSHETVIATGTGNSSPDVFNDESSGVLIPSPKVTVSAEISNCLIPSPSSSTSASGGPQSATLLDSKDASTKDIGNRRTVSLVFFRW